MKQRILSRRGALIAASLTAGCHNTPSDRMLICLSPVLVETDAGEPEAADAGPQGATPDAAPVPCLSVARPNP